MERTLLGKMNSHLAQLGTYQGRTAFNCSHATSLPEYAGMSKQPRLYNIATDDPRP